MSDWLAQDEYKKLAECEDGFDIWGSHRAPSTLDPTNEESVNLVKKCIVICFLIHHLDILI